MFAKLAVSVAVAFLGAYPVAMASGLFEFAERNRTASQAGITFVTGIMLFFLTICLIGPTLRLISKIMETLKQVEERPKPVVALTMLGLGTLCAISSMVIQFSAESRQSTSLSMRIPSLGGDPPLVMQSSGSLALGILTILTFLLGTVLISLGIWASLKPTSPTLKPATREFDETAT